MDAVCSVFFGSDGTFRHATYFSHSSLGGAKIFAKLRSKIAKSPKIGGKVVRTTSYRIGVTHVESVYLLGRVTRHPAGMHCPSWDDAFVSSVE